MALMVSVTADTVKASRFLHLHIAASAHVRGGDLGLEALPREIRCLEFGMEKNAGVGEGFGQHIGLEFKVLEIRVLHCADIEQVRARSIEGQGAIDHLESTLVFARFPAIQRLAVKKLLPFLG